MTMWNAKSVQIGMLSLAELLAMALWFSATAVIPQWIEAFDISNAEQAWLTISVQLGFVTGALLLSIFTISDRFRSRYIFSLSAFAGALLNACIPLFDLSITFIILLRFLTGMTLAGVYPVGMKIMTTWCRKDRGLCIGILVGALTAGSSLPHLLNALSPAGAQSLPDWRLVLYGASILAMAASLIALLFIRTGPHTPELAPFNLKFITEALTYKPVRLANFGYFGHMWELYAMWAWVPVMLIYSYQQSDLDPRLARLAGFGTIAIGAVGCVLAGRLADRLGRTTITTVSLLISGGCALTAGLFIDQPLVLTIICLIWGFAVVSDSAQFSAAVSELSDQRYIGTALTLQTSMGFLLTLVTIRLIPTLVDYVGWKWCFTVLAIGPIFGIYSMLKLRNQPEASKMASGNR